MFIGHCLEFLGTLAPCDGIGRVLLFCGFVRSSVWFIQRKMPIGIMIVRSDVCIVDGAENQSSV